MPAPSSTSTIVWFADLGLADIDQVGGKNASLGEMVRNLTHRQRDTLQEPWKVRRDLRTGSQ